MDQTYISRGQTQLKAVASAIVILAILLLSPIAGQAQATGSPEQDTVTLSPLLVTVLRSPTRLDELPFSVSMLSRKDLAQGSSGAFLSDALHGLAGVQIQNRYNASQGERISIRGFGARAQFGVRGIKILVDGIPATLPDGQTTLDHLDIGSLGSVEALRGPAAALYGNGAGGVLLFRSRTAPSMGNFGDATVVVGSDGLMRLQTSLLGRAGSLGYTASVAHNQYDGFRNNPTDQREDPYSTSERTTLNASLSSPLVGGEFRLRVNAMTLDALNPGSLPRTLYDEGSNQAWGFNVSRGTRKDLSQAQVGAAWDGPVGSLTGAFSAYGVSRSMDAPIPPRIIDLDRLGGGFRGALGKTWGRLNREAAWDAGFELEFQRDDRQNYQNTNGERGDLNLNQQEHVRAGGLFMSTRFPLSERASFTGALRYDDVQFSADDAFVNNENPDDSGESSMSSLSPSVGLHFALGDAGIYASMARSFETPTTTELGNQPDRAGGLNPNLDPQVGWTAEIGVRGDVGHRFAYDFATFNTRLSGQLVPFEVASAPGRTFFRNAGTSRIRGFDASARAVFSEILSGRLAYSYVDARFTEFQVDGESFNDNKVPGIAPQTLGASLRAEGQHWFGEARMEHRGAVPVDDANEAEADSYQLLNLRFGATEVKMGSLEISPFVGVTNLTDARYISSVVVNAFGGRFFEPGPGRGAYLGMAVRMGSGR